MQTAPDHVSIQISTRRDEIELLLEQYKALIDQIPITHTSPVLKDKVFMLTGSTGRLGSHLLQSLMADPDVTHIFCLNRNAEASKRQSARNRSESLICDLHSDRVTFLTANYSEPNLGLNRETYALLSGKVTYIIHNAWPVDFNMPLSSFRPQLDGVINIIKLAASSKASIQFLSSVSAVSECKGRIPEEVVENVAAPAMGYGESKYLAERILDYAAQNLELKIQIARIGQIAGQVSGEGEWNRSEWLPSLIRSSLYIGAVPTTLGPSLDHVDWIPIDMVAKTLLELTGCVGVYNLLNPNPVQWTDLLPVIIETLSSRKKVQSVSFDKWIYLVEEAKESDLKTLLGMNPALKLLAFYKEMKEKRRAEWAIGKGKDASPMLSNMEGIKREWMERWIRTWLE